MKWFRGDTVSRGDGRADLGHRRADLSALGVLALLLALLFHSVLFSGRVFYQRDVHSYFMPLDTLLKRTVSEGTWPLWNPYVAFGQPLLANPQFEALYPFTWLLLGMSPTAFYTLFVVAHSLFSAIGVYLLCRTLALPATAALTGAAVWVLSGPWLSLVNNQLHLAGAAWMPWVLLAAERFVRHPTARRAATWGIALGLQLLAGSAEMALLAAIAAASRVVIAVIAQPGGRTRLRLGGLALLAQAVGAGLASAQWVPTAAFAWSSARGLLTEADRTFWSVHPAVMLQTLLPIPFQELALGRLGEERLFASREPFLSSLYLGLPAAALVMAAATDRLTPWRRYLLVLGALAVLAALGRFTPAYRILTVLVPPLRLVRYPAKAMALVALLWALLAAAGLEACRRRPAPALVATAAAWGAAMLAASLALVSQSKSLTLAGWVDVSAVGSSSMGLPPAITNLWSSTVLGLVLGGLALLRGRGWEGPFAPLAAACVIADLFAFHVTLNQTAPRQVYSYQPIALPLLPGRQWSRIFAYDYSHPSRIDEVNRLGPQRLAAADRGAVPDWSMAAALRTYPYPTLFSLWRLPGSYDPDIQNLYPHHLALMVRFLGTVEGKPAQTRLLQLGAVERVLALHARGFEDLRPLALLPGPFRGPIHVFAVPEAVPRTYVATRPRFAEGMAALDAILAADFRLRDDVVLSRGPVIAPPVPAPAASGEPTPSPGGWSRIVSWRPNAVRLEAEAPVGGGYAVLVDTFDRGWRAAVDGQPAEVLRANVAFRAVRLDAGRHSIDFVYRPRSVLLGLALTGLTLVGLLSWPTRARRHAGDHVESASGER